jgi:hypothetical protein
VEVQPLHANSLWRWAPTDVDGRMMELYRDLSGDSGVDSYECGADWIRIRFKTGGTYLYDHVTPGSMHVERMKQLARSGDGLATYVNQHVRRNFSRREQ